MSSDRPGLRARFRYSFDNSLARGPIAMIGWLALFCAIVIALLALFIWIIDLAPLGVSPVEGADGSKPGYLELLWVNFMRVLDAGTMGGDTGSWAYLFSMLAATMLGVFAISTLIGLLTSGIEGKMSELQRGKSVVLESGHTLVLGWSPQVFDLIQQLVEANRNQKNPRIVVLADRDTTEMHDEIRQRVPDLGPTKVICRSGRPIDIDDLRIVNPAQAKSVVILEPEVANPDIHVIKSLLALKKLNETPSPGYHVVAEFREGSEAVVAQMIGAGDICPVIPDQVISGLVAQASRQTGLSAVFEELLDFEGCEIYVLPAAELAGSSFGEALFAHDDSTLIGLWRGNAALLAPEEATIIEPTDQVIVIAEDDDTTRVSRQQDGQFAARAAIDPAAVQPRPQAPGQPERTLVIGWGPRAARVISELDGFAAPGSQLTIVRDVDLEDARMDLPDVERIGIDLVQSETTSRADLERLDLGSYDQVILLPNGTGDPDEIDAQSLVTLIHLRDLMRSIDRAPRIVTEMVDMRNRQLVQVSDQDDFVVSSHLTSLMVAQISENRMLCTVFRELFGAEGRDVYLAPADLFVPVGTAVSFATVVESARQSGVVAIGHSVHVSGEPGRKVTVNPAKGSLITFSPGDDVVVIGEAGYR